jgi:hypothetical protein
MNYKSDEPILNKVAAAAATSESHGCYVYAGCRPALMDSRWPKGSFASVLTMRNFQAHSVTAPKSSTRRTTFPNFI